MQKQLPSTKFKLKDEGKAHLAKALENAFNARPMYHLDRRIDFLFDAYPILTDDIKNHWCNIFGVPKEHGRPGKKKADAKEKVGTEKRQKPFGYGAIDVD